jgi:hypothetical protein
LSPRNLQKSASCRSLHKRSSSRPPKRSISPERLREIRNSFVKRLPKRRFARLRRVGKFCNGRYSWTWVCRVSDTSLVHKDSRLKVENRSLCAAPSRNLQTARCDYIERNGGHGMAATERAVLGIKGAAGADLATATLRHEQPRIPTPTPLPMCRRALCWSAGRCSRVPRENPGVTALHLVGVDLFDGVTDHPLMSKRIAHRAGSLAIEMILGRTHQARAGADGLLDRGIRVVHVNVDDERAPGVYLRSVDIVLSSESIRIAFPRMSSA